MKQQVLGASNEISLVSVLQY